MHDQRCKRPLRTRLAVACFAATSGLALAAGAYKPAAADEQLSLLTTIDVQGKGLGAFDISFVDPTIGLYALSDRTNASIDLFDTHSDTFIGRVGGFKGVVNNPDGTANNNISGPDGNVILNKKEIWAGDGDSTVKVIDIKSQKITDSISTNGTMRADEMAFDKRDHLLAVANDADTPPFVTFINTDNHKVVGTIKFDGTNGAPDATGGLEQTQWSPQTGLLYTSVPQIGPDTTNGGVAVIDPHSMTVIATYPISNCSPAGLALGPNHQALVGCSASFGTSPVLTQTVVIDITDGSIKASLPIGGNDQVWYDRGSNHYYLAARSNEDSTGKADPVLGTVDASTNMLDASVASSTTAHSVAADQNNLHVFLPIGFVPPGSKAGTDPTNICATNGCVAVYVPSGTDVAHR